MCDPRRLREITVSATGATGNSAIMPRIVNQLLGTKFKIIGGYSEGAGQTLALERGEVGAEVVLQRRDGALHDALQLDRHTGSSGMSATWTRAFRCQRGLSRKDSRRRLK